MKKYLFICLLFICLPKVNAFGQIDKYVTDNGSGTICSESSPCSLSYAFANGKGGENWHVKAGNYGSSNYIISNSGTSGNPIKFIGYKTTPGDIVASEGSTFSYGDVVSSTEMPLIEGLRSGNVGSGTGIYCPRNYVELHNFQVKYYNVGVSFVGDNNVLNNVISIDHGDFDSASYNGKCFAVSGDNVTVKNCFGLNGAAEGYYFTGDNHYHEYNSMYSDNATNPTDYYYLMGSDAIPFENSEVRNIHIERQGDLAHGGHGLITKRDATDNNFYDCTIINTTIEVSYYKCQRNNFYDCFVDGENLGGGIIARDGAHDNRFERCEVINSYGPFLFHAPQPIDMSENDYQGPFDNVWYQCEFDNNTSGINFFGWNSSDTEGEARDNIFEECTFSNMDYMFEVNRENSGTQLINCTLTNIDNLRTSTSNNTGISLDYSHQCTTSSDLGFSLIAESDLGATCLGVPEAPVGSTHLRKKKKKIYNAF